MRRFVLSLAAVAALAVVPAQAAAQTLADRFDDICLKTGADPAKVVAKARELGFAPFEAPAAANLQEVEGFNKLIDGKPWVIVAAKGNSPAAGAVPAQTMRACNVSGPDAENASVKAIGQKIGKPDLGAPGQEMYFFTEQNGVRTALNPADNNATMAALNSRGFWIILIMTEGEIRSVSIIHSVASK